MKVGIIIAPGHRGFAAALAAQLAQGRPAAAAYAAEAELASAYPSAADAARPASEGEKT